MIYDLIIIGGGAAGLFAAANAPPGKILLLEKMDRVGKKLLISGGGMCNLTNKDEPDEFIQAFGSTKKANFLKPSLFGMSPEKTVTWFEKRGLPLLVREDGKIFPDSLKSLSLVNFLVAEAQKRGVTLKTSQCITSIKYLNETFELKTENDFYKSRFVLLATGGKSYPGTGSDGSALRIVKSLGHKLTDSSQALAPVFIDSYDFRNLAGSSLKNITIDFYHKDENKRYLNGSGDLLFTHTGLSGPVILNNSRFIRNLDKLDICFISGGNRESLRETILKEWNTQTGRNIKTVLKSLGLFSSLADKLLEIANISKDAPCSSLGKKKRNQLINLLLHYPMIVSRKSSFSSAMATAGGVSLEQVNRKTLESRIVPGLYFAGEVLDLDGDTGGYNIQAAFSTSFAAVQNLALKLNGEDPRT